MKEIIQHAARHFPRTSATAHKREGDLHAKESRRIEAGVDTHVRRAVSRAARVNHLRDECEIYLAAFSV